ncbi:MAG: helix-turn-helix domain-containing protein [Silvibacterium sp.]
MEDRIHLDTNGNLISKASDPLHSIQSGCAYLGGISENTLAQWLSQEKLRRTKVGGRTMIRQSELDRMIVDGGKSQPPKRRASASARPGKKKNRTFTRRARKAEPESTTAA